MPLTSSSPALNFTQVGSQGPSVLLLMGYGMRGDVWKPQVDGLSLHCRVAYFDNRGIGESEHVDEKLSMLDMANDAARVLDELAWHNDVHLVGVSMGGMIAQELALLQPERFASLSLLATHAGGPGAMLPSVAGIANFLALQVGPKAKRHKALARLLYPKAYLRQCDRAALRERMRLQIGSEPPRAAIRRQLEAITRHDTRKRLAQIRVPTLIVKPEKDILVRPANSERLAKGIRHASVMRLADAGHGLTFQSAEEINARLLQHFKSASR